MHHPPGDERTLDLHGDLLGRTIRKATARPDPGREDVTVTIELMGRVNADPATVQPHDCDRLTVQLFGGTVFKLLDGGLARLLGEDGTVVRESPTVAELSQGVRALMPALLQAIETPDTPPSERPTLEIRSGKPRGSDVSSRSTVPSQR